MREDHLVGPGGVEARYGVAEFQNLAIGVLPLFANGDTVLVGQWRYPLGAYSWELPEGGAARGTDPLDTARRELIEETGLRASGWAPLLTMHTSNSVTDEISYCFLAWDLTEGEPEPEEVEVLATHRLAFAEALARVLSGEITDSLTVAMLLKASHLATRHLLPDAMPAPLRAALNGA